METAEQRMTIRQSYQIGRQEAWLRLATVQSNEDSLSLELEGAHRMINSDGLQYNLNQGFWHTINGRPLSLLRSQIEEGVNNV